MALSKENIQQVKMRYEIVGNDPQLQRAIETAMKVAPTDLSVLITGESGVGKEAFSKIIHNQSKRKHNQFIAINCGAIPEGTIDSELFGHEKGAFTSAHDTRKGYFETVNKGTIFLDEIGELPGGTQSRLLRVLESGEFLKVGSSKVQKTDVRIIAATNRDLLEDIERNKFRDDLYYRLSTVGIHIPPLRERKDDILLLFAKFASDFAMKHNIPPIELDESAEQVLINYPWPGNIRQLKNFVEELSVLETDRNLNGETLKKYLPKPRNKSLSRLENSKSESGTGFEERELIYKFLFDLKQNVNELKTMMYQLVSSLGNESPETETARVQKLLNSGIEDIPQAVYQEEPEVNETSEQEEPLLSLQDQEKEMIRKALKKHGGKRKSAAGELGISERTLYRKIKEYELEDV